MKKTTILPHLVTGFLSLGLLFWMIPAELLAQSTWRNDAEDNNWTNGDNWNGGVPNSVGATVNFGPTALYSDVTIEDTLIRVGTINFQANAIPYGLVVRGSGDSATLVIEGSGVQNLSSNLQTFNVRGSDNDNSATLGFTNSAGAGSNVTYNIDNFGTMYFQNNSNAGSATIHLFHSSSDLFFSDNSSASTATILNQSGGVVQFTGNASASSATFQNANGGRLFFAQNANGTSGTTLYNEAGGVLDISRIDTTSVTIGHLSGAGNIQLGNRELRVGSQNTNATISGVVSDGFTINPFLGPPPTFTFGSLVKEGTGTLLLTAANTYTGTTYIEGGTLSTNNVQALGVYDGVTIGSNAVVLRNGSTLDLQSNLNVQDFQWLNGTVQFNPATTIFNIADQFEYSGTTDPRNFSINSQGLSLQTYTLINFGSTNFNSGDDFTATFFNTIPNVTYNYDFLLNSNNLQIIINGATATGPVLQNSAPVNIPTFADFLVDGMNITTGTPAENNIINSLQFTPNSGLAVSNNLEVTSGIVDTSNGGFFITGGTLSSPNNFQFNTGLDFFLVSSEITGASGLGKTGPGMLVLNGNNTYTGITGVLAGTLLISGDQTAATGDTSVAFNSVLGGNGTIGGNVNFGSAATLSPGASIIIGLIGNGQGTLKINGNLELVAGTTSLFELGQIGVVGGATSDLVDVGGNMTLAGTLQIYPYIGFQQGAYRLFNYGGTLTNNGPIIDSSNVPAQYADHLVLSTAIGGQVNLIVTGPDNIAQFWDGDAGIADDGIVQGGDGIWTNFNPNFPDPPATANSSWQNGTAMFAGTAGIVTVADEIYVQGMQFMTDGYEITGGDLATDIGIFLNPADPILNSARFTVDTDVTAIISAPLRGTAALQKLGEGTLLLNSENAYTGGTIVSNGILQTDNLLALSNGPVTIDGGFIQPLSNLNINSLDWNQGGLRLLLGDPLVNIDNNLTNLGDGGTFILDFDGMTPLVEQYTLLTYNGTSNFTNADFTGISGFAIPNVAIQYAFEITESAVITNLSAQAWGPLLQNSAPAFIPTFADFFVQGQVRTGELDENNTIKSLHFDPGSNLQVYNNLTVTSGNFTVSGGKATIQGGTVLVPGEFNKFGSGTLDARSNFVVNGNSYIHSGALAVNGTFQTPLLHVLGGGTLMGNGIVIGNVLNGGTVAPGNSIGLLTILGNYTQLPSGALQIEVGSVNNHDVLVVSGTAVLDGTLEIASLGYKAKYGDQIPFLRAGNITGKFDVIEMPDPEVNRGRFLNLGKVGVLLVAPKSYTLVAETPNQSRVAAALDNWIGIESGDIGAVTLALDLLREEQYPQAFEAIMPGFHDAALSTAIELSHSQGQLLHQQLSARRLGQRATQPQLGQRMSTTVDGAKNPKSVKAISAPQIQPDSEDYRWSTWFQGSGLFSSGGLSLAPGENFESGTFIAGADYALSDHFALGIFAGYSEGWGDYDNGGEIDLERILFGAYATIDIGHFYLNTALGIGTVDYDINRPIQFATLNRSASSEPDGHEFFALLGGGYDFRRGNWTFGPQASLQYSKVSLNSFIESGADSLNLRMNDPESDSLRSHLGARVAYTIQATDRVAIIPELRAFWQHEFLDGDSLNASLDGGNGPDFTYESERDDKDALFIGAGLGLQIGQRFYANLYYNADLGRNDPNHNVSISATVKF
ncbi:autotransporter domain-containing protein [Phragmitibacter flavus]|uniref:Autotransporter domain-containing protein n=1 Tax=Phragmitibacter flavus TaxID=2576071 RepID=A0A5R8KH76_9BACT|nr:autotransporter outer membrane beta-barrel domain-containing protein [Phragmitibacter flavus]TLD71590.1 autotransporter domain-containing protein [Phragmitibacter flavus]